MPFEITWEPEGLSCRCHGPVTAADVSHYLNRIASERGFDGFRYRITIALGVTDVALSADELRWSALVREIHAHSNPDLLDVLVTDDPRIRSLWRQFVSVSKNPQHLADFASVAEARAWIDRALAAAAVAAR